MALTDLINEIGDEKIKVQFIHQSLVSCKDKKRTQDAEVTFATNEINSYDVATNSGKLGIVVWVDREDYNDAVESLKKI